MRYQSNHRNFGKRYPKFGTRGHFSKPQRGSNGQKIHASKYVKKTSFQEIPAEIAITHRFQDFEVDQRIKDNILSRGYSKPTPIQDQAINPILIGRDVVGIANTGTGKTAAFLIPVLHKIVHDRTKKALILCPTRELAMQIHDELLALGKNMGVSSLLCIGGVHINEQIRILRQNPSVIIGTPGRIKDLFTRGILKLAQFKIVILDEVDRMVDIGFIKEIKYIISFLPKERQSLFFSATVSSQINQIIQSFLKSPITISVKTAETAQAIDQDVIRVRSKEEKISKLQALLKQTEFKKVLIFGRTKWNVERLAKGLQHMGFSAASIHGNKSQNQRTRALSQFRGHQVQILVATDIAARGLDVEGISHVINFDEPATFNDYVHRIGRTGRAQNRGKALTFVL